MGPHEPYSIAFRGLSIKSKIGGQPVIADQPHAITDGIGNVDRREKQAKAIDTIMNDRADGARDAETEEPPEVFLPMFPLLTDENFHLLSVVLLIQNLTDIIKRTLLYLLIDLTNIKTYSPY